MTAATQNISSKRLMIADLLAQLGGISPARVRLYPSPGTATEQDVIDADENEGRLFELVDGTLVEKPMGLRESILALAIGSILRAFVIPRNLGLVAGEAGMFRLFPGCIRMPDVAYASHSRRKGRPITTAAPEMAPDLAVEVLSNSKTIAEMNRKRDEYFFSGVKLVWIFDPRALTVAIYRDEKDPIVLSHNDILDGGEVLPGFSVPIKSLFDEVDQQLGKSEPIAE